VGASVEVRAEDEKPDGTVGGSVGAWAGADDEEASTGAYVGEDDVEGTTGA